MLLWPIARSIELVLVLIVITTSSSRVITVKLSSKVLVMTVIKVIKVVLVLLEPEKQFRTTLSAFIVEKEAIGFVIVGKNKQMKVSALIMQLL